MNKTINVSQIPKDTGPAGWNQILPPADAFPQLQGDIEADWVVVGGGFTGIAAARRLSQLAEGSRIVLVDAGRLAQGPAGRNSGFMIDLPHDLNSETYAGGHQEDLKQIRLNREAIAFAAQMAEDFNMPQQVFDPCGKVTGAGSSRGEKHINSYQQHLNNLQEEHRVLDAADMKALTGIDFYHKGLYTPGAVMIQPAAFIRLAAQGINRQVDIYENSPVVRMETGAQHCLVTPNGSIRARKVILAVNGHIQSFGFYPRQLLHVFTYASMTRALTPKEVSRLGGQADWGILPADPMGTTVRRVSSFWGCGDRLTVRNRFTLNQSMEVGDREMASVVKAHDRAFAARFPMLNGVEMEHRWGGRLCLSWNSVPAFGELEEGIYSAACQNGLGTVKGTLSGIMAAELAVHGQSTALSEFASYDEPRRLPPEPFLTVGATAQLRWKEWLAGVEL